MQTFTRSATHQTSAGNAADYLKRATIISVGEKTKTRALLALQRCAAIRELRITNPFGLEHHDELLLGLLPRNPSLRLLHTSGYAGRRFLRAVAANCPQLRELRFADFSDEEESKLNSAMAKLARACSELHTLSWGNSREVDDEC